MTNYDKRGNVLDHVTEEKLIATHKAETFQHAVDRLYASVHALRDHTNGNTAQTLETCVATVYLHAAQVYNRFKEMEG